MDFFSNLVGPKESNLLKEPNNLPVIDYTKEYWDRLRIQLPEKHDFLVFFVRLLAKNNVKSFIIESRHQQFQLEATEFAEFLQLVETSIVPYDSQGSYMEVTFTELGLRFFKHKDCSTEYVLPS